MDADFEVENHRIGFDEEEHLSTFMAFKIWPYKKGLGGANPFLFQKLF